MMVGSTATTWVLRTLASGLIPYRLSAASLTTTFAAAPSQIPEAFAAGKDKRTREEEEEASVSMSHLVRRGWRGDDRLTSYDAGFTEDGRELGHRLGGNLRAWVLILGEHDRLPSALLWGERDGHNLVVEGACVERGLPAVLRLDRIGIALVAGDAVFVGEVLGSDSHCGSSDVSDVVSHGAQLSPRRG